ncbi:hypothetical protein LINPERPRIM_LOCUS35421 [Linum perenne]
MKKSSFPSYKAAIFKSRRGSSLSFRVEASMVVPDVAEAAEYALTPSLKNFLLNIVAGTFVLSAIAGAIIGVSNFDPVKRA